MTSGSVRRAGRRVMHLLFAALMFLSGCGAGISRGNTDISPESRAYHLYFLHRDLTAAGGQDALSPVNISLPETLSPSETARCLLDALLKGSRNAELQNAVPVGTKILSLIVEDGQAEVDFSAAYSGLSGIALTLADYAVTLTLTQLPEISSVIITVQGQDLAYRSQRFFAADDVLLSSREDVVGHLTAALYYLDYDGNLAAESRELDLYEGDTQVAAVTSALLSGPVNPELTAIFPAGFAPQSVWLEDAICYVNLSSYMLGVMSGSGVDLPLALQTLSHSLCYLESVDAVRYLVDGEFAERYGRAFIGEVYT